MSKKRVKNLRKRLRAICILAFIRAILQGAHDDELHWAFDGVGKMRGKIILSFDFELLDSDIVVLENLSDKKIEGILSDSKSLLGKHCKSWGEKWWEKLGRKKPSKSDRGNGEEV